MRKIKKVVKKPIVTRRKHLYAKKSPVRKNWARELKLEITL